MDRPIDPQEQRRRRWRRLALPAVVVVAAFLSIGGALGWLRPSLRRDQIRTALVERGEVVETLDASGLVVPEIEQVLTAAAPTRILAVLRTPGTAVVPGDPIVQLDDRDARRDVKRFQEQIALKENSRRQADLTLIRSQDDLRAQRRIKELELRSFDLELERSRQLFDLGLIVQDEVRRAETDVERAGIELEHLDARLAGATQDHAATLQGLDLEIAILETDLERARELLARTAVTADRPGILTWVATSEGAAVAEGEPVARVADLSSFRVDATLSDVLARRLTVGLPATVRSGETTLNGYVRKILPAVSNGIVTFEVALDRQDHPVLRPNLRVDVHAVTARRENALRLRRGSLLTVDGREAVFVVRGGVALRTPVTLGLASFDSYEIVEGLAEGDEVVISDMSDYRKVQEVKLR